MATRPKTSIRYLLAFACFFQAMALVWAAGMHELYDVLRPTKKSQIADYHESFSWLLHELVGSLGLFGFVALEWIAIMVALGAVVASLVRK